MSSPSALLPLDGKRILVTRSREKAKPLVDKLTALGAVVHVVPVLSLKPTNDWSQTDRAIAAIEHFDWIVFASANAVQYFLGRCRQLGALQRLKCRIAAIGPATAESLHQFDLTAQFVPSEFIAETFVSEMNEVAHLSGAEILWPRGNRGRLLIAQQLEAAGGRVQTVTCYESSPPVERAETATELAKLLKLKELDIIMFASGESVKNFVELVMAGLGAGDKDPESQIMAGLVDNIIIASIGRETSNSCRQYLGKVDLEAAEHTAEGMIKTLIAKA